ncbi:hypothetical protein QZK58_18470, partial [Acinetobacter baumannii]|nr:hypothetical protein [Acinetobacter baumannii]
VLIEECHTQYSNLQLNYRGYLNEINNGLREYRIKNTEVPFFEQIKIPAKQLLESSLYSELLEKPAMEKLSYSR